MGRSITSTSVHIWHLYRPRNEEHWFQGVKGVRRSILTTTLVIHLLNDLAIEKAHIWLNKILIYHSLRICFLQFSYTQIFRNCFNIKIKLTYIYAYAPKHGSVGRVLDSWARDCTYNTETEWSILLLSKRLYHTLRYDNIRRLCMVPRAPF